MAKTLQALLQDTRQIIGEETSSNSHFTDSQLTIWLNDAYRLLALEMEIFPATEAEYTSATEITLHPETINANNIRFKVQPEDKFQEMILISYDELIDLNPDFENETTGQPRWAIRTDTDKIRFHPPLNAANDGQASGVKIYELRMPTELASSGDTPELPSALHQLMSHYAAYRAFQFVERNEDSVTQLTIFRSGLRAMKGVNRRTSRNAKRWRGGERMGPDSRFHGRRFFF